MVKFLFLILFTSLIIFNSYADDEKWFTGIIRGHEDLTRFAIQETNKTIKDKFYPEVYYGDSGLFSKNQIILGNYHTDFPTYELCAYYSITAKNCTTFNWQNNPNLQNIHSLRNIFPNNTPQPLSDTLLSVRLLIMNNTNYALQLFYKGQKDEFLFWIGHVLHTIQDSFVPCHVKRNLNTFKIFDMCTYGPKFNNVCHHKDIDTDDYIWTIKKGCFIGRNYECLKVEAQNAVKASTDYLKMIYYILDNKSTDEIYIKFLLEDFLNKYYVY